MISENASSVPAPHAALTSRTRWVVPAAVTLLLAVLYAQLALTALGHSMSVDEGNHIYSGYMSWTRFDFGLNPEHPPLVKLLATLPLLNMPLKVTPPGNTFYKLDAYEGGRQLLLDNDKEKILFRARMSAAVLTVLLALLIFLTAQEMFGTGAGFLALTLAIFDPNLLAHGALVTTDVGVSCFLVASIYAFYRYVKAPSPFRLALVGLAAGLAWASKHSGILVFLMLGVLALTECVRWLAGRRITERRAWKEPVKLAGAFAGIVLIAAFVLWAFYGFRYQARASGSEMHPALTEMLKQIGPGEARVVSTLADWKLLPQSYLFGAVDVSSVAEYYHCFILGNIYTHGVWFYFPVVMLIKCTEGLLALMLLALVAVVVNRLWVRRELLFLAVPAAIYLAIAMNAHLCTGVRHIMPVYAFLWPLAGGVAWTLVGKRRQWAYVLVALAALHIVSSLATFPSHIAYANSLWGGPDNTHRLLTDSNADWGQQLVAVKRYLQARKVEHCWFAYIAEGETAANAWGVPCKSLPNLDFMITAEVVPEVIDGPVLISADELSGYLTGPGPLNPYGDFQKLRPSANIEGGVLVYDGQFSVPRLSALTRRFRLRDQITKDPQFALTESRAIVALDPENAESWLMLGQALKANGQKAEALNAFQKALAVAESVQPAFQAGQIPLIRQEIDGSPTGTH